MDGATTWKEIVFVLTPDGDPRHRLHRAAQCDPRLERGFWTLNLTTIDAAPLTQFIASFSAPQGNFWAKLSAASTLAIAPIVILGWFGQRQLVRGLTFGAVK
jgi:sorbitol/mannitol transport system permease protein